MKKRYINLIELEISLLQNLKKEGLQERLRDRAHALLLSNKGYSISKLSEIFEVRQATIIDWFNRWEKKGIEGLVDLPKTGRPRTFDEMEEKKY